MLRVVFEEREILFKFLHWLFHASTSMSYFYCYYFSQKFLKLCFWYKKVKTLHNLMNFFGHWGNYWCNHGRNSHTCSAVYVLVTSKAVTTGSEASNPIFFRGHPQEGMTHVSNNVRVRITVRIRSSVWIRVRVSFSSP